MIFSTRATSILSAILLLASCQADPVREEVAEEATRYRISVNAIASTAASSMTRYVLRPGEKDAGDNDLQYQEFSRYVHGILTKAGFVNVDRVEAADLLIALSYGIRGPEAHEYTYSLPTFGVTGFSTFGATHYRDDSSSTTFGSISPTYGITGIDSGVGYELKFIRHVLLTAVDLRAFARDDAVSKVWQAIGVSVGSSGDLRRVFPYILVAVEPFLGKSSRHVQEIEIEENDPRVSQLFAP